VIEPGITTATASIDPVDLERSVLIFGKRHQQANPVNFQVKGELSQSEIVFHRVGTYGSLDLEWHVLEHTALKVRRGVFSMVQSQQLISLGSPVPLNKAFVLVSYSRPGASFGSDDLVAAEMVDESTLRLSASNPSNPSNIAWQIVEFTDGTIVHSGKTTMPANSTGAGTQLPQPVDIGRSFVLFSYKLDAELTTALTAQLALRGRLQDAKTVTFDRDLAGSVGFEISWFVVQLAAGYVQSQSLAFSAGVAELSPTLATFDPKRSVAMASAFGWSGKAAAASEGRFGETHVTLTLEGSPAFVARRASADGMATVETFVASF
jgi:hypothetical protein